MWGSMRLRLFYLYIGITPCAYNIAPGEGFRKRACFPKLRLDSCENRRNCRKAITFY